MEATKKSNKERYREMAISFWENKKKGIHTLADKIEYTKEYCDNQIDYFKKLKL